ncbi:diacylglycerol/lipid kinase family protein [Sporosarcina siberiensis]|uniref:Diacylglycerol/lipid kinase family protein n=1 Tax=Sporosarcina siberiensis TaxID=1365606 RepID=A0ABW4SFE1_9BACL
MFLFIINPISGNGKAVPLWNDIEKEIPSTIKYQAILSNSEIEARDFIVKQLKTTEIKTIVIIGGDGTVNSVIQESAGTHVPIAIFPTGSGNDTARMFSLTRNPELFVKKLIENRTTCVDLLKVNGRYGITVVGVGIDATIGERANNASYKPILNKLKLGSSVYTIAAIFALMSFQTFTSKVIIDEQEFPLRNSWLTAIGNTTSYGGGLVVCPTASPTDGLLNITMVSDVNRLTVLCRSFPALLKGRTIHGKGVTYKTGKEIQIQTDRPIQVVLDGEIILTTPLHICVQEMALKLVLTT